MEDRKMKKDKKTKAGGFKSKNYNSILQVENSPGGKLTRNIKRRIENDPELKCMNLLVQEKNGTPLASLANFADPHTPAKCGRSGCFVCQSAGTSSSPPVRGKCWKPGCVYKIICKKCKSQGVEGVYHGETGLLSGWISP